MGFFKRLSGKKKERERLEEEARKEQELKDLKKANKTRFAAITTGTTFARRINSVITDIEERTNVEVYGTRRLHLGNADMRGNVFYGLAEGIKGADFFNKAIKDNRLLEGDIDIIDDFMATGGGGGGYKIEELKQLLNNKAVNRVNLHLLISEYESVEAIEAMLNNRLNTILELFFIGKLMEEYRDNLSITFISNKALMKSAGEYSGEAIMDYGFPNELLGKCIMAERWADMDTNFDFRDLIGKTENPYGTIGFASQKPYGTIDQIMGMIDKMMVRVKNEIWLDPADFFSEELMVTTGKLVAVIPPKIYDEIENDGRLARVRIPEPFPEHNSPDNSSVTDWNAILDEYEKGNGIGIVAQPLCKLNLKSEYVRSIYENQQEIYVFCRVMMDRNFINDFFKNINDRVSRIVREASKPDPKSRIAAMMQENYKAVYGQIPRADCDLF